MLYDFVKPTRAVVLVSYFVTFCDELLCCVNAGHGTRIDDHDIIVAVFTNFGFQTFVDVFFVF